MLFLITFLDTVQNLLRRHLEINQSAASTLKYCFIWLAQLKPVTGFANRPLSGT